MALAKHFEQVASDCLIDQCAVRALKICSAAILSSTLGPVIQMAVLSGEVPALYFDFQGHDIELLCLVSATQMQDQASLKTLRELPAIAGMLLKVEAGDQTFAFAMPLQEERLLLGASPKDVAEVKHLSQKISLADDGWTVLLDEV